MSGARSRDGGSTRHAVRGSWVRWTEPWYAAYGLAGLVLLGIGPIGIPLAVDPSGPTAVAIVVSAFYFGALFTPLVGSVADRTRTQRGTFLACFPLMSASLILFAYGETVWEWALLAAVFGAGGAVVGTIGGMFMSRATLSRSGTTASRGSGWLTGSARSRGSSSPPPP